MYANLLASCCFACGCDGWLGKLKEQQPLCTWTGRGYSPWACHLSCLEPAGRDGMGWDGIGEGLKGREVATWGGTYNWKIMGRTSGCLCRPSDCEGKWGLPWFPNLAEVLGRMKGSVSLLSTCAHSAVLPFRFCSCSEAVMELWCITPRTMTTLSNFLLLSSWQHRVSVRWGLWRN